MVFPGLTAGRELFALALTPPRAPMPDSSVSFPPSCWPVAWLLGLLPATIPTSGWGGPRPGQLVYQSLPQFKTTLAEICGRHGGPRSAYVSSGRALSRGACPPPVRGWGLSRLFAGILCSTHGRLHGSWESWCHRVHNGANSTK